MARNSSAVTFSPYTQATVKPSKWSTNSPEMGDLEMEETTLSQEVVNVPLLPLEEGRVENILFYFSFDLKFSKKEQFPHSPGHTVCALAVNTLLHHS